MTFYKMDFGSYWFATGTPSYLVKLLKLSHYNMERLETERITDKALNSIDANPQNPIPVIYQSGYLTIKGYNPEFKTYTLGFPNREVEEGFLDYLLPFYTDSIREGQAASCIEDLAIEIRSGKTDAFLRRLQSLFAGIPYDNLKRDMEWHYQSTVFLVFRFLGFYVQKEYHTSQGRIDLLLQTDKYIYMMEFKVDGTAEEALAQINATNYAAQFATDPRKLFKVGVNFSNETKTIDRWVVEVR
jgi:hypothetical protein